MTDQPPPSDKKPRRRAAPRKRSAAKRAAEKAPAAQFETAETPVGVTNDAIPGGERIATIAAEAGSAVPTSEPEAAEKPASARRRRKRSGSSQTAPTAAEAPAQPPEPNAGMTPSPVAVESPAAPAEAPQTAEPEAAAVPAPPISATPPAAAPAPPTTPAQSAQPSVAQNATGAASPFARQAELRPGELIRVPLSVRWRDLDAFNHVNNSKYLSYLEEARLRWMLAMPGMGMDDDVAPVVAASNLNYRRPIAWPGEVVVELFVERIGGSSVTIGHRIVDAGDGRTVYCDGNVVMVWIDRNSGRSAPLPDSVQRACR